MSAMSTRVPLQPAARANGHARVAAVASPPPAETDQQTAPLEAGSEGATVGALALLDHRTRARSIPVKLAPHGHYLALSDGAETRLVRLEDRITHVGRGLTADLRFEDQRVSRTHAILARAGRTIRLLDNRSAHGTFLNERRVIATNIRDGDVIRFGPVVARYVEVR